MKKQYTIKDLKRDFGTERQCLEYLLILKCRKNNHCPTCDKYTKFYFVKSKKRFDTSCNHSIYPTKNTIYYNSSTPLVTWFQAIFMFSISKNNVSAKKIERMFGVTYKTAWRMANKIRNLMIEKVKVINEIIQMNEIYIVEKNKQKNKKVLNVFVFENHE